MFVMFTIIYSTYWLLNSKKHGRGKTVYGQCGDISICKHATCEIRSGHTVEPDRLTSVDNLEFVCAYLL